MSERDKREYEAIKADPVKYAAYLEKKRLARLRRQSDRYYETERKRRWRMNNRETDRAHHKAHYAVEKALKQGLLVRPESCQKCSKRGPIEAHHQFGYAAEHWLAVTWLCQKCHSLAHRK